ncbi:MAG: Ig-like domain-containing protein, partial [Gemmatimonadota bacterium]
MSAETRRLLRRVTRGFSRRVVLGLIGGVTAAFGMTLACTTENITGVVIGTVTVSPATRTVLVGETADFNATVTDQNGATLSGAEVDWSVTSEDGDVASIDGDGRVTALAEGVAQVVARFQGREGAATLTVMPLLQPPDPPTDLAQLKSDGDAPIPSGGTTDERTVVFRAGVSDPNPEDRLRLEVEVQPVGTPFSDTPTGSSVEVRNGGVATVAITLDDGTDYRWRARAIDQTGRSGPWVAFGDEEADFRVETPVTRLAFATQPSGTSAGATISPAVRVAARKASGDTDAAFSGEITLRLAPGTGTSGATLSGTRTVAAVAGVATFDDLAIDVTGEGYRLEASSAGLPEVQSAAFDVAPAGAGRLAFVVQPTEVRAGEAIAPAVEVAVRDEFGNPVPDATDVVTLAIAEGTGIAGAALSGTVSVAAVDGVARFDDLAIDSAGPGYALTARATDL